MWMVFECFGFINDINDIKMKILIWFGFLNFFMLDYDENGDVCCLKLFEIKWLMLIFVFVVNIK